ncbi:dGTPase [Pseudoalteromonas denitrificans]|uniref:dGTPase n=1 Tax=Pseudoalteromonas denitrificans DSM 6059 TaxID=1123010 RepID=A0A1I1UQC6_9GAMM|nr:dGTPase [Pseudoalteromonas denitrificans]SFD72986.1 dGTPase [Pseudoalteromonas denitrificans DSM 6059]
MDFDLKINKLRPKNEQKTLASSLESDRGRIINSAALRRLQQKTQVFPLERNAAVRSRLTHSLEVQQNGRFIAKSIIKKLKEDNLEHILNFTEEGYQQSLAEPLVTLVEMACLMHDIGNPAFGHFGEAAINDWFLRYLSKHEKFGVIAKTFNHTAQKIPDTQEAKLLFDICNFEGNAQAIRIIYSLSSLNLTYCQIASILKYTRCATEQKPHKAHPKSYLQKKVGYYFSEESFVLELYDKLQIQPANRHPVAYIMEAADDIAYCLADMEDAVEKGFIRVETLKTLLIDEYKNISGKYKINNETQINFMRSKCEYAYKKAIENQENLENEFFIWLRVGLIHPLVTHATNRFIDNLQAVYDGSFNQSLLEDGSYQNAITAALKNVAFKHVFCHTEVEELELQGYKITSGILNEYQRLLDLSAVDFQKIINKEHVFPVETRLLNRISSKFISVYKQTLDKLDNEQKSIYEFYYRCRLLQDFISGMTDQFAYDTYRTLTVAD